MKTRFLDLGVMVGLALNICAQTPPPPANPPKHRTAVQEQESRPGVAPRYDVGQPNTQTATNATGVGGAATNYGTYYGSSLPRTNFWETNQTPNAGGLGPTNYGTFYGSGTNAWGSNRFRYHQQQQQLPNSGGVGTNYGIFYSTGTNPPFNRQPSTNAPPPPPSP